jgi:hypothetical protein
MRPISPPQRYVQCHRALELVDNGSSNSKGEVNDDHGDPTKPCSLHHPFRDFSWGTLNHAYALLPLGH